MAGRIAAAVPGEPEGSGGGEEPTPTTARSWGLVPARDTWVATLAIGALSWVWLWPLPRRLAHWTPSAIEPQLTTWNELWMAWLIRGRTLTDAGSLKTTLINAPEGTDLRHFQEWGTAAATAVISVPLEWLPVWGRLEALVAAQTLGLAAAWTFTGVVTYRLGRSLAGNPLGGIVAATAVLASPFLRGSMATGLFEFLWLGWLVLAIHAVLGASSGRWLGRGLAAGLCLCLAALATRYLLIWAVLWMALFVVVALVRRDFRRVGAALVALVTALPVALFLAWPVLTRTGVTPDLLDYVAVAPGPAALVLPLRSASTVCGAGVERHIYSIFLGWGLIALGIAAVRRGARDARLLALAAGLFALIAMGRHMLLPGAEEPTRLPLGWLGALFPPLDILHGPRRTAILVQLLLAACAATLWRGEGPSSARARWAALLCSGWIAAESVLAVLPLYPLPVIALPEPTADERALATAPARGPLLTHVVGGECLEMHHRESTDQVRQMRLGRSVVNYPGWPGSSAPSIYFDLDLEALDGVIAAHLDSPRESLEGAPFLVPMPAEKDAARLAAMGVCQVVLVDARAPSLRTHVCQVLPGQGERPTSVLRCVLAQDEGGNAR